jgi:CheY-like chemotaxis protein
MTKPVILCVDDEKAVLESLKAQLRAAFGNAYQYEMAEDAFEALELIQELVQENIVIILIVSDWLMPGMRGDDFLIRVAQAYPRIIRILLTGQADAAAIERAQREANLYCCLRKPWSKVALVEAIQTAIQTYE